MQIDEDIGPIRPIGPMSTSKGATMKASVLVDVGRLELRDVSRAMGGHLFIRRR